MKQLSKICTVVSSSDDAGVVNATSQSKSGVNPLHSLAHNKNVLDIMKRTGSNYHINEWRSVEINYSNPFKAARSLKGIT